MPARWKRPALVLLGLAILVFAFTQGGEAPPEELPKAEEEGGPIRIPLPPLPKGQSPSDLAPGAYTLKRGNTRVVLELKRDRKFQFLAQKGNESRTAEGTWSLSGHRLTLAYFEIDDASVGDKPTVVVNTWTGKTIILKDTGLPGTVTLTKVTMIKHR